MDGRRPSPSAPMGRVVSVVGRWSPNSWPSVASGLVAGAWGRRLSPGCSSAGDGGRPRLFGARPAGSEVGASIDGTASATACDEVCGPRSAGSELRAAVSDDGRSTRPGTLTAEKRIGALGITTGRCADVVRTHPFDRVVPQMCPYVVLTTSTRCVDNIDDAAGLLTRRSPDNFSSFRRGARM